MIEMYKNSNENPLQGMTQFNSNTLNLLDTTTIDSIKHQKYED